VFCSVRLSGVAVCCWLAQPPSSISGISRISASGLTDFIAVPLLLFVFVETGRLQLRQLLVAVADPFVVMALPGLFDIAAVHRHRQFLHGRGLVFNNAAEGGGVLLG